MNRILSGLRSRALKGIELSRGLQATAVYGDSNVGSEPGAVESMGNSRLDDLRQRWWLEEATRVRVLNGTIKSRGAGFRGGRRERVGDRRWQG